MHFPQHRRKRHLSTFCNAANRYKKSWHLPIFPARHQASIFGTTGLNFRVRNGNGWITSVINTNDLYISINHIFCQLFFWNFSVFFSFFRSNFCKPLVLLDFIFQNLFLNLMFYDLFFHRQRNFTTFIFIFY